MRDLFFNVPRSEDSYNIVMLLLIVTLCSGGGGDAENR